MQLINLPILALSLFSTLATATPTPVNPALKARAACTKSQEALADGINKNIAIQNQELTSVDGLAKLLSAKNVDPAQFTAAKTKFIKVINSGVTVRLLPQNYLPLLAHSQLKTLHPCLPFSSSHPNSHALKDSMIYKYDKD